MRPEIIIVDDDEEAAKSFAEIVTLKVRRRAIYTSDVNEVESIVTDNPIKVMVLDQKMPELTGIELYKQIHKNHPLIQAVMLTGEADRNEVMEANRIGYAEILDKKDITKLPEIVLSAYTKYTTRRLQNFKEKRLILFNPIKTRLYTIKFFVCDITLIDENYMSENGWQTKQLIESDEKEEEIELEYNGEIIISADQEIRTNSKISGQFNLLKTEIDHLITSTLHTALKQNTRKSRKVKNTYRLQHESKTTKTVASKKI